jgi:ferredoxin
MSRGAPNRIVFVITFDRYTARSIRIPFEESGAVHECRAGLAETLADIFPRKRAFFEGRDGARMTVHFPASAPFGPAPDTIAGTLFPDLRGDAAAVRERFDLAGVTIAGLSGERELAGSGVSFAPAGEWWTGARRKGGAIPLTAVEFRTLSTLCREGRLSEMALLSVFVSQDDVRCFYSPSSKTLRALGEADDAFGALLTGDPARTPYDPVNGRVYDPDIDGPAAGSGLLTFAGNGYVLAPKSAGLFGFPWFGGGFGMRRGAGRAAKEHPCSNCGACVDCCPSAIHPSYLAHQLRAGDVDGALALRLGQCVRCGWCSLVCPSGIDLHATLAAALDRIESEARAESTKSTEARA